MDQEKFEIISYRQRLLDHKAAVRLEKNHKAKYMRLETKYKNNTTKIKYSELSDETLRAVQQEFLTSLSEFNIEGFTLETEIKKIDRVLKFRKKPIVDE